MKRTCNRSHGKWRINRELITNVNSIFQIVYYKSFDYYLQEPTVRRTYNPNINTTCISCKNRDTYIKFNKEQIRIEILRKLNMREPPNVTMDLIPQHMIRQLTKNFEEPHENRFQDQNSNMMGDDPNIGGSYEIEEEDDFHFQTRLINVLAKNGK